METKETWLRRNGGFCLRAGAVVAACGIATFAGISSWTHGVEVAKSVGEPNAPIVPATVDGMMIAGTLLAAYARLRGFRPGGWTNFCLWAGGLMTLGFNVLSALDRSYPTPLALGKGVFVASMSAVALIATVEAIFHPGTKRLVDATVSAVASVVEPVKHVVESTPEPTPATKPAAKQQAAKPQVVAEGVRGRRPGQGKPGYRPNPSKAQPAAKPQPTTKPVVVDEVHLETEGPAKATTDSKVAVG